VSYLLGCAVVVLMCVPFLAAWIWSARRARLRAFTVTLANPADVGNFRVADRVQISGSSAARVTVTGVCADKGTLRCGNRKDGG